MGLDGTEGLVYVLENGELVEANPSDIVSTEVPAEIVGVSDEVFQVRMDSIDNLLMCNAISTGLLFGAVLANVVVRFFHAR